MTRLLIVSLNYAPELTGIAPYATGVAEHLAARGYDVSVVAGMPHYPEWRLREAPERERRNGVDVRRVRHYVPQSQSAIRRAMYEASSLMMALPASRGAAPHAVLAMIPSLSGGIVARTMAARHRVPYGIVVQDLMAPAASQVGDGESGPTIRAVAAAEGWVMRGARAVGIVAEGFRPYVESRGVAPARVHRLRNWSRGARATIGRDDMRLLLGWPNNAVVCLHAGNMGQKQALENIIECARMAAASDRRLLFMLMGGGNQATELSALARRYALGNLRIVPTQPDEVYASVLKAADILLLNQRGSVREMSLPSKLTSYLAAGRPTVAAVAADSEAARELTESGAALMAAPDDPGALLAAIRRVADDGELARDLAARGQAWARDVLSPGAALEGYERMVESVLSRGIPRRNARSELEVTRRDDPFDERMAA